MVGPLEFILAGVLVGFCVGVTGVGGGSLMTPILISLFKIEPHIAIGTDLLYAAISKFCGSLVHAKKNEYCMAHCHLACGGQYPCFICDPLGFRELFKPIYRTIKLVLDHGTGLYVDLNRYLNCVSRSN